MGNGERGTVGNGERGTGNGEWGTGNGWERGTGNGEKWEHRSPTTVPHSPTTVPHSPTGRGTVPLESGVRLSGQAV